MLKSYSRLESFVIFFFISFSTIFSGGNGRQYDYRGDYPSLSNPIPNYNANDYKNQRSIRPFPNPYSQASVEEFNDRIRVSSQEENYDDQEGNRNGDNVQVNEKTFQRMSPERRRVVSPAERFSPDVLSSQEFREHLRYDEFVKGNRQNRHTSSGHVHQLAQTQSYVMEPTPIDPHRYPRLDNFKHGKKKTGNVMSNHAGENSFTIPHQKIESLESNLENCLQETYPCTLIVGFSQICQIHCALQAVPKTHPMAPFIYKLGSILTMTIHGICNPVRTTFELGWKYFVHNSKSVHSFVQWQKKMGIDVEEKVQSDVEKLGEMLLGQMIKYADTPFSLLKEAYEVVESGVLGMKQGSTTSTPLFHGFNPGCFALELQTSANKFIDIFHRNPSMIDVLLSGTALVVNAGKYIPGPHQKIFRTVALANELLVGTSCGILYWTGMRGATCDQIAGISKMSEIKKSRHSETHCPSIAREIKVFVN